MHSEHETRMQLSPNTSYSTGLWPGLYSEGKMQLSPNISHSTGLWPGLYSERKAWAWLVFWRKGLPGWVRGFPGPPVLSTLPSSAGGVSLTPGAGAKLPHAPCSKNQNIKQKHYHSFKNGPHQKNLFKKLDQEAKSTSMCMQENT